MQIFKKYEYKLYLGDSNVDVKCKFPDNGLEFDAYIVSPKIKLQCTPNNIHFNITYNEKEKLYAVSTNFAADSAQLYLCNNSGPVESIPQYQAAALLHRAHDLLSIDWNKKKKKAIKDVNSLMKTWRKDMGFSKESSEIISTTLEDMLNSPDIIYSPEIESDISFEGRSPLPIIYKTAMETHNKLAEYAYSSPEKYLSFFSKESFFCLDRTRPINLITLAAFHNLINPNSMLYSELENMAAVEKSFFNFSKVCEYYLPGFSKNMLENSFDDMALDYTKHRMLSGFLAAKAVTSGFPRYTSISNHLSTNLAIIGIPWGLAYFANHFLDIGGLIYAAPFTINLILGKAGIANPFFYNEARYHITHSFDEGLSKFSTKPETQLMGLARLGATRF